jgi:hypothetical protein
MAFNQTVRKQRLKSKTIIHHDKHYKLLILITLLNKKKGIIMGKISNAAGSQLEREAFCL